MIPSRSSSSAKGRRKRETAAPRTRASLQCRVAGRGRSRRPATPRHREDALEHCRQQIGHEAGVIRVPLDVLRDERAHRPHAATPARTSSSAPRRASARGLRLRPPGRPPCAPSSRRRRPGVADLPASWSSTQISYRSSGGLSTTRGSAMTGQVGGRPKAKVCAAPRTPRAHRRAPAAPRRWRGAGR